MSGKHSTLIRALDQVSDAEYRLTGVSRLLAALTDSFSVVKSEELEVLVSVTMDLSEQLGEAKETWEKALDAMRAKDVAPLEATTAK